MLKALRLGFDLYLGKPQLGLNWNYQLELSLAILNKGDEYLILRGHLIKEPKFEKYIEFPQSHNCRER